MVMRRVSRLLMLRKTCLLTLAREQSKREGLRARDPDAATPSQKITSRRRLKRGEWGTSSMRYLSNDSQAQTNGKSVFVYRPSRTLRLTKEQFKLLKREYFLDLSWCRENSGSKDQRTVQ